MKKDERGFSLSEVMIGVLILSVATLGIATMMTQSFRGIRGAEQSQNAAQVAFDLKEMMSRPATCTGNLKGQQLVMNTPLSIQNVRKFREDSTPEPQLFMQAGQQQAKLTVTGMSLIPKTLIAKNQLYRGVQTEFFRPERSGWRDGARPHLSTLSRHERCDAGATVRGP